MRRILGIDFTSAPRGSKPITCAVASLTDNRLAVSEVARLRSFAEFERLLAREGPWVAGMDFPFSQPRTLVEMLAWPTNWAELVSFLQRGSRDAFGNALKEYRDSHPQGSKQPKRKVDVLACSCSPMMMFGVPVAKMFFEGAARIEAAGLHVVPCRPTGDTRVAVEAYPKLVAKKWIGKSSYKSDSVKKRTAAHRHARER